MKRKIIATGIIVVGTFILLYVFNRLTIRASITYQFTEVQKGEFEIALTTTGELVPERTVEIKGPLFDTNGDIRSMNIRIQDLVPEGTVVKKGDFAATLSLVQHG